MNLCLIYFRNQLNYHIFFRREEFNNGLRINKKKKVRNHKVIMMRIKKILVGIDNLSQIRIISSI